MAENLNVNAVFENKKFVDLAGLDYFWGVAKSYIDAADSALEGRVGDLEAIVGELVGEGGSNNVSIADRIQAAITALDLANTYAPKQATADAIDNLGELVADRYTKGEVDAMVQGVDGKFAGYYTKGEVDGKFDVVGGQISGLDGRVKDLEDIDHEKLMSDAINAWANQVSPENSTVDTFKELIDYAATHDSQYSTLAGVVQGHDNALTGTGDGSVAKRIADAVAAEAALRDAADEDLSDRIGVAGSGDTAGTGIYAVIEANEKVTAKALTDLRDADTDLGGRINGVVESIETINGSGDGSIAKAAQTAENNAKGYTDEKLEGYYTKGEVDGLQTAQNTSLQSYADGKASAAQEAAVAEAKSYTDALYTSIVFAEDTDIDTMFAKYAPKTE